MDVNQESLKLHEELRGKIEVVARRHIETRDDLSLLYTPGVAEPCREIAKDYEKSFTLTRRSNLVAVITDGSAVLGLGDIGPAAGMPVMEGKCALFKEFGGVDAFPLCVDTKDVDKLVETIALISKSFGGINLEDIAAPRCFEVERRLKEEGFKKPVKIAIMGCIVNGPGEASDADIGIAGGKDCAVLFEHGEKIRTLKGDIVSQFVEEIHKL